MRIPFWLGLLPLLGCAGSWAGGCWIDSAALTRTGFGASAARPEYARLVDATARAEAFLRNDAVLNAIADVRYQVQRSLTLADHEGGGLTASVWLRLHLPDVWKAGSGCAVDQGAADYLNRFSVGIEFNALSPVLAALGSSYEPGQLPIVVLHPDVAAEFQRTGTVEANADAGGMGMRALRADGKPVLMPLSVGEHLAYWERWLEENGAVDELEALHVHRAQLNAGDLTRQAWSSPAALADHMWGYAQASDAQASPQYQIAPDLLAPSSDPGAVRFVVVTYSTAPGDHAAIAQALKGWLAGLDNARIAHLITGAGQ